MSSNKAKFMNIICKFADDLIQQAINDGEENIPEKGEIVQQIYGHICEIDWNDPYANIEREERIIDEWMGA